MSGLFGGPTISNSAPVITSLRIQTSGYGRAIALCYGRTRVSGNLVWQHDFTAISHEQSSGGKGGGGGGFTTYTYTVAAVMALCAGPIAGVPNAWADKVLTTPGDLGLTPYLGDTSQTPYGYVTTNHPSEAVGYRGVAYLATGAYNLGDSDNVPNHSFELSAMLPIGAIAAGKTFTVTTGTDAINCTAHGFAAGQCIRFSSTGTLPAPLETGVDYFVQPGITPDTNSFFVARAPWDVPPSIDITTTGSGTHTVTRYIPDANPASVAADLLTHTTHGAGFPSAQFPTPTDWAAYCQAAGIWISPAWTDQEPAAEMITRLCRIGNAAPVWSAGQLKIIPYGDQNLSANGASWTANVSPVAAITDDDLLAPVTVTRIDPSDAHNHVRVEFWDRAAQYNTAIAEAKDQAEIELFGQRTLDTINLREVCDADVARRIAQIELQRNLYIRNTYKFQLGWAHARLEPMNIVTLTELDPNGVQGVPVRILTIEESDSGALDIIAEDAPPGVASAPDYVHQTGTGYTVDYNAAPGTANAPVIFDAPAAIAETNYEIWMAVSGSGQHWGGAEIWVSDDDTTYTYAGIVRGRARHGTLTADLASGTDPDTSNSIAVDLGISGATLLSGTAQDCDSLNTLCWIEGELVSYQTATLTGPNAYTLGTRLRRGAYGTEIGFHGTGARLVRCDQALFRHPYDAARIGSVLYVKLLSINEFGGNRQDLASVTAYTYTIVGPAGAPAAPTGLSLASGGTHRIVQPDGVATPRILVTWTASNDPRVTYYDVQWKAATDADYASVVASKDQLQTYLSPVQGGATYDVRVRAMTAAGFRSPWITGSIAAYAGTSEISITTMASVRTPVGISPIAGTIKNPPVTLTADSYSSIPTGIDYLKNSQWQVSDVSDFSTVIWDSGISSTITTEITPAILYDDTKTYHWRTRRRGELLDWSSWSTGASYNIGGMSIGGSMGAASANLLIKSRAERTHRPTLVYHAGSNCSYLLSGHYIANDVATTETYYPNNTDQGFMRLHKFNHSTGAWTRVHHFGLDALTYLDNSGGGDLEKMRLEMCLINDDIYIVGWTNVGTLIPRMFKFSTTSLSMVSLTPPSVSYINSGLWHRDGYLYAKGTYGVMRYNIASDTWNTTWLAYTASIYDGGAMALVAPRLFFLGGNSGITAQTKVVSYDMDTSQWDTTTHASMPTAVAWHGTAVLGLSIYIHGGTPDGSSFFTCSGSAVGTLRKYTPAKNLWEVVATTDQERVTPALCGAMMNGVPALIMAGGWCTADDTKNVRVIT